MDTAPLAFGFMVYMAFFVVIIVYLVMLQVALNRCDRENRTLSPGMVWLMLIPFVGLGWQFYVNHCLLVSYRREYRRRGLPESFLRLKGLGIAKGILDLVVFLGLVVVAALFNATDSDLHPVIVPAIQIIYSATFLAVIPLQMADWIVWVLYWQRIESAKNNLRPPVFMPTPTPLPPGSSAQYVTPAMGIQGTPASSAAVPPPYCSNCGATLGPGSFCPWCGKGRPA